jgi:hypothetical protein
MGSGAWLSLRGRSPVFPYTDEDDALIPLKLYEVKVSKTGYVSVTDEEGERVVCPAHWFIPVRLAPKVRQTVADLAA